MSKFIKERLDICKDASQQLKCLRKRLNKSVKKCLKYHKKVMDNG